ncbi:MAG TPA: FKBP-type peptidyl-prolyl cis-trans isomerase [Bacteroidia bacterium]|jgi:FKBP-type peptidyl-prolyl cis-trans isomerase FkpA|nr:FKBP-type peptidyl-prolyl cis-trans isomerase [Bacteroidia bacterium]
MKFFAKGSAIFVFTLFLVSYGFAGGVKNEYKTDPVTGVKYILIKHDSKGATPKMGDIAFVRIMYKRSDDSVLFNSHAGNRNDSTSIIPLSLKSSFHGSLEDGITLMAAGDSASFLLNADSVYLKAFKLKVLPMFIKPGSNLKFYIKLVKFETLQQMKDDQLAMIEKRKVEAKRMQSTEGAVIEKYLADNKINVKPLILDSLYILERSGKATGKSINDGDSVEIKYTGMLLDGTIFDQSDKGDGGKGTYKFLYKHNAQLIRGWLEVLPTMHEGEKVRFLLPSGVAYGPNAAGKDIKPYSPLLFEIEVLKIISPLDK